MSDLIYRQDAIELVKNSYYNLAESIEDTWAMVADVENLPSAEPEIINRQDVPDINVGDMIYRSNALSCFHDWVDSKGDVHSADEMPEYQRIEALPSVEPEVIDLISRQAAKDNAHRQLWYRMNRQEMRDRIDEWLDALPSAEPERKKKYYRELHWIPCSERLPEIDETVLVTCRTKKGANNVNRAYCDKEGFWHGSGSMSNVVAWMPLPEPYKPKEESE